MKGSDKSLSDYLKLIHTIEKEKPEDINEDNENLDEDLEQDISKAFSNDSFIKNPNEFLNFCKDCLNTFNVSLKTNKILKFINSDSDSYEILDSMILGITIEQGLIVVLKIKNENNEEKNSLLYVKNRDIKFVKDI